MSVAPHAVQPPARTLSAKTQDMDVTTFMATICPIATLGAG